MFLPISRIDCSDGALFCSTTILKCNTCYLTKLHMQMVGPDWFQVEETVIAALKEENKVTDILINIVRKLLVTQRNLKKKKSENRQIH